MNNQTAATATASASPATTRRSVNRPADNIVRTTTVCFELHPSHARLARSLDGIDRGEPLQDFLPKPQASTVEAHDEEPSRITREQVITVMAAMPDGASPLDIGRTVLRLGADEAVPIQPMHRIYAILQREIARGVVDSGGGGRAAKRKLTDAGRAEAAKIARVQATRLAQAARERALAKVHAAQLRARAVSSVFDYAGKVGNGLLVSGRG